MFYPPSAPDGVPVDLADVEATVDAHVVWESLREVFTALHANGQDLRLYITLLTLGMTDDPAPASATRTGTDNPLLAVWQAVHRGRSIVDDLGDTYAFDTPASDASADWDTRTMDPSSGYKRHYYRRICRRIARNLDQLRSDCLALGFDIADYLYGVEVCNEVDSSHVIDDGTGRYIGDGESWGLLYVSCASAMIAEADWLPIMLPGLASYGAHVTDALYYLGWDGKYQFVERMLLTIYNNAAAWGVTIGDIVRGLDYHYYHRSAADVQSLAFLYTEVRILQQLLDSRVDGATVTVLESGVNVLCTTESVTTHAEENVTPATAGYDSGCEHVDSPFPYPEWTDMTGGGATPDVRPECEDRSRPGANDFQAMSVWTRLSVAHAAGVAVAGWHCPMGREGAFAGVGLRRDLHDEMVVGSGDPATLLRAAENAADQRPSWAALHRYIEKLGLFQSASLLNPVIAAPESDRPDTGTWADPDFVFVLEFLLPRGVCRLPYRYLLFIDPFGSEGLCSATVTMRPEDPAAATVAIQVSATAPTEEIGRAVCPGELPQTLWRYEADVCKPPDRTGPLGFDFAVRKIGYPVLFFASEPMVVDHITTA